MTGTESSQPQSFSQLATVNSMNYINTQIPLVKSTIISKYRQNKENIIATGSLLLAPALPSWISLNQHRQEHQFLINWDIYFPQIFSAAS